VKQLEEQRRDWLEDFRRSQKNKEREIEGLTHLLSQSYQSI